MYSVYHSLSNGKQKVSRLLSLIVGKARICYVNVSCILGVGILHILLLIFLLFFESLCPVPWLSITQVLQRLRVLSGEGAWFAVFSIAWFSFPSAISRNMMFFK